MSCPYTAEQIMALAPDTAAAQAGKGLAVARKWQSLGFNDEAVWGECQGSGSKPYQTEIDLRETAFKCSCPSRKFPCKHGLGLFLLLAGDAKLFEQREPPDWVKEWLAARNKKAEQRAQKSEATANKSGDEKPSRGAVVDSEAQQKRAQHRQNRVDAGLQDLSRWLTDLMRRGLANLQSESYSFWDNQAARLVDAQASGIARMLREMAGISATGEGWQARLLERLARLHLLISAYQRIDQLPSPLQADIRAMIGWSQNQDELLAQTGINDNWFVLAQAIEEDSSGVSPLRVQRIWLVGATSQQFALLINFAHGRMPFEASFITHQWLNAELVFYPSAWPLRALVKDRRLEYQPQPLDRLPSHNSIKSLYEGFGAALTLNPWLERYPAILRGVTPVIVTDSTADQNNNNESNSDDEVDDRKERWLLTDRDKNIVAISKQYQDNWQLLARSGGYPLDIFGEWNGDYFLPLSVLLEN